MPSDSIKKTAIAKSAVEFWRGDVDTLQYMGDSANYVCSFAESGKRRYLRFTLISDRTKNQIEAELDFILYLKRRGVGAARPIISATGHFIEEIKTDGNLLLACVFEEAEGERFNYDAAQFNKEHFRLRGRTLGRIHALSKWYSPSGDFCRFAWDEDQLLVQAEKLLPRAEKIVRRELDKLIQQLQNHPKTGETFGLIHGDFGETNYRYQHGLLNVFDFDDSCYHWFAYDLAVTVYPHGWREEGLELLNWLLEGYSENMPVNFTLAEITMFCQWRLIYMFLVYARKWGFENLSDQQARWFDQKRENIARGYRWRIS